MEKNAHLKKGELNPSLYEDYSYYESEFFFNPIVGEIDHNVFYGFCRYSEDEDLNSGLDSSLVIGINNMNDLNLCFYQFYEQTDGVPNGDVFFLNYDNQIIMYGYMLDNKPHGIYYVFCEGFPYCGSEEINETPLFSIIYHKGKMVSKSKFNSNGEINSLLIKRSLLPKRKLGW